VSPTTPDRLTPTGENVGIVKSIARRRPRTVNARKKPSAPRKCRSVTSYSPTVASVRMMLYAKAQNPTSMSVANGMSHAVSTRRNATTNPVRPATTSPKCTFARRREVEGRSRPDGHELRHRTHDRDTDPPG